VARFTRIPDKFRRASGQVIESIFRKKDPGARHSFALHDPLAVSSTRIGEDAGEANNVRTHTFTDFGVGFGAIQPLSAEGRNLYRPDENVLRAGEFLQETFDNIPKNQITGVNAQMWATFFAYNQGGGTLQKQLQAEKTPKNLRDEGHPGAVYADGVFEALGFRLEDEGPFGWDD